MLYLLKLWDVIYKLVPAPTRRLTSHTPTPLLALASRQVNLTV